LEQLDATLHAFVDFHGVEVGEVLLPLLEHVFGLPQHQSFLK
jgi:hypothetical protein